MEFAREVSGALRLGVHLVLAHEFQSVMDTDDQRGACAFGDLWKEGWTPQQLMSGSANIYKQIAEALKPGKWRPPGLAKLIVVLSHGGGVRADALRLRAARLLRLAARDLLHLRARLRRARPPCCVCSLGRVTETLDSAGRRLAPPR